MSEAMTDPVKRYVATCDCVNEAIWGDYVSHDDYARLEQECERLADESHRNRVYLVDAVERSDRLRNERDAALKLLARCQEKLDPHRDAVLWGEVVEAFRKKP